MEATTEVDVALDSRGRTVVRQLRCEAPLLVRVIDEQGPALTLAMVNGAAGPLGGDHLRLELRVGVGADVIVRSVAAQMAQPGPTGLPSTLDIDIDVADDATLHWAPEPMVSVTGSDHRTSVRLSAASSSRITLREVVSLGRHGEPPGRLALRQRVTIDDVAVLDHETEFAPGALLGIGAHGAGRLITNEVCIGQHLPPPAAEVTADCARATVHLSALCALTITTA